MTHAVGRECPLSPLLSLSLSLLVLPQGIGGVSDPPAYWPPVCYGAFGGVSLSLSLSFFRQGYGQKGCPLCPRAVGAPDHCGGQM